MYFIGYRNTLNKLKKKAKRNHLREIISKNKGNSQAIWTAIRIALNKINKKNNLSTEFVVNGELTSDLKIIADAFCSHFAKTGERVNSRIESTDIHFSKFLGTHCQETLFCHPIKCL